MLIRLTRPDELDGAMLLYDAGRAYMRANGNTDQWTNGFPPRELIAEDIKNGISYTVEDDGGNAVGIFAFIEGPDPTYSVIYDGAWPDGDPYYVIHRIAVTEHRKGIASFVYEWALSHSETVRIDTHRDNIPMQNALEKNGFVYCGIIHLENGAERLAFQKKRG